MINDSFTEQEVLAALRRTRNWLKRNPDKRLVASYANDLGCYCLVGRFFKELCPDQAAVDTATGKPAPLWAVAHDVLVALTKRLSGAGFYQEWGNDIKFGRVSTINDLRLLDEDNVDCFIERLEAVV